MAATPSIKLDIIKKSNEFVHGKYRVPTPFVRT